jgi:hypothetical protein
MELSQFFARLLPLNHLFTFDAESLTAWWVSITIAYAVIEAVRLWRGVNQVILAISAAAEQPNAEHFLQNPLLQDEWSQYSQSFVTVADQEKTHYLAANFFHENQILSHRFNPRYWSNVPNVLVGMGILGTFVGLTYGISGFKLGSKEAIEASIAVLLSGMATAFVTSIWGMLLSLLFGLLERVQFGRIGKFLRKLTQNLDKRYLLTPADEQRLKQQEQAEMIDQLLSRQRQQLSELFVDSNDQGQQVMPANILRELILESQKQSKALQSFSSDLADGIKISTQTVESMGGEFAKMLEERMSTSFSPAFAQIEAAVKNLREAKEESSGHLIQQVVEDLQTTMQGMSDNFQQSLTGSARQSLESLAQVVGQAGSSLLSFPEKIDAVMKSLEGQTRQIQDLLSNSAESSRQATTAQIQDMQRIFAELSSSFQQDMTNQKQQMSELTLLLQSHAQRSSEQMSASTQASTDHLQSVMDTLQQKLESMMKQQESGIVSVHEVIQNSREILQNGQTLMAQMGQTMSAFDLAFQKLQTLSGELTHTGQHLENSGLSLKTASDQFETQAKAYLTGNQLTLKQLESALSEAQKTAQDYSSRFSVIQNGLTSIFQEIEQGLERYQNTTREQINKSLSSFSEQLSQAAKYLVSGVEELRDVVEEAAELRSRT